MPSNAIPHILPWNGKAAALSLTFDDGDPCHIETAIPELDKRGLKGTFFVIPVNVEKDATAWKRAFDSGHELAAHTRSHEKPEGFSRERYLDECVQNKLELEKAFGQRIRSFAYPYCVVTEEYRRLLNEHYLVARGGEVEALLPESGKTDWLNTPAFATLTHRGIDDYSGWIKSARNESAWCVFMIHGIEGTPWGWEPITKAMYKAILDMVAEARSWLWVDTYANVAAYFKAQKSFESSLVSEESGIETRRWQSLPNLPSGLKLKLKLGDGERASLSQKGKPLEPDGDGLYLVDFDALELSLLQ